MKQEREIKKTSYSQFCLKNDMSGFIRELYKRGEKLIQRIYLYFEK